MHDGEGDHHVNMMEDMDQQRGQTWRLCPHVQRSIGVGLGYGRLMHIMKVKAQWKA